MYSFIDDVNFTTFSYDVAMPFDLCSISPKNGIFSFFRFSAKLNSTLCKGIYVTRLQRKTVSTVVLCFAQTELSKYVLLYTFRKYLTRNNCSEGFLSFISCSKECSIFQTSPTLCVTSVLGIVSKI